MRMNKKTLDVLKKDNEELSSKNYGVVYGASLRHHHVRLAARSAESIKKFYPDFKTSLYTEMDEKMLRERKKIDLSIFDEIFKIKKAHVRNKFDAIINTPYERTLYLDNDTLVLKPVFNDMFKVLDRFDVAVTHAPLARVVTPLENVPTAFPEMNGGVLLFKNEEKIMNLFRNWEYHWKEETIETRRGHRDQPYLRKLLWESDLKICILPEEYNVRRSKSCNGKMYIHHRKGI
jgi:hypothetical protein